MIADYNKNYRVGYVYVLCTTVDLNQIFPLAQHENEDNPEEIYKKQELKKKHSRTQKELESHLLPITIVQKRWASSVGITVLGRSWHFISLPVVVSDVSKVKNKELLISI